jgi:hypothetical protein
MKEFLKYTVTSEEKERLKELNERLETHTLAPVKEKLEASPNEQVSVQDQDQGLSPQAVAEAIKYVAKKYIHSKFNVEFGRDDYFNEAYNIFSHERRVGNNDWHVMAKEIAGIGYFSYFLSEHDDLPSHDAYKVTVLMDLYVAADKYQRNPNQDNLDNLFRHVFTAIAISWQDANLFDKPFQYYQVLKAISCLLQPLLSLEQRKKLQGLIADKQSPLRRTFLVMTELMEEAEKHAEQMYSAQERQHSPKGSAVVASKEHEPLKPSFSPAETSEDLGKAIELIAKRYSERTTKILKDKELFDRMMRIITEGVKNNLKLSDIEKQITDSVRVRSAWLSLFDSTVLLEHAEIITRLVRISMVVADQHLTGEEKQKAIFKLMDEILARRGWPDYEQAAELLMILALVENSMGSSKKLQSLRSEIEGIGDVKRQAVVIRGLEKDMKKYAAKERSKVEKLEPSKPATGPRSP